MLQSSTNVVTFSSALLQAIKDNNLDAVKTILNETEFENSEQIDAALDEEGFSPIHLAASLGFLPIIQTLKEKGARLDIPLSEEGIMPIHLAADNGHVDVVAWLVEKCGVNPNVRDNDDLNALDYAALKGYLPIVAWLVENGGFSQNSEDENVSFPLHSAARENHLDIVKWLINKGVVHPDAKDSLSKTALHYAAEAGHLDIVKYLVHTANADPKSITVIGLTPLGVAIQENRRKVVNELIQFGVNVSHEIQMIKKFQDMIPHDYEYYIDYLIEIGNLIDFFTNPTNENALDVGQALECLEKHKQLNLRNQEGKILLQLILQNLGDKSLEDTGVSEVDRDDLLLILAIQTIDRFQLGDATDEKKSAVALDEFSQLIEDAVNSISNPDLKVKILIRLGERYEKLMRPQGRDFTTSIVEAYEKALEFTDSLRLSNDLHLRLTSFCLQIDNQKNFKENDDRRQKALHHAFLAGESHEAASFRKRLFYGIGNHDDKQDPLSPELLWQAFDLLKAQRFAMKNQQSNIKAKQSNGENIEGSDSLINPSIEEKEAEPSDSKRQRDEDELEVNQISAPTEANIRQAPVLLHAYLKKPNNDTLMKVGVAQNTEPKDTCQSSTKKTRVDEELIEDVNLNDNNNFFTKRL